MIPFNPSKVINKIQKNVEDTGYPISKLIALYSLLEIGDENNIVIDYIERIKKLKRRDVMQTIQDIIEIEWSNLDRYQEYENISDINSDHLTQKVTEAIAMFMKEHGTKLGEIAKEFGIDIANLTAPNDLILNQYAIIFCFLIDHDTVMVKRDEYKEADIKFYDGIVTPYGLQYEEFIDFFFQFIYDKLTPEEEKEENLVISRRDRALLKKYGRFLNDEVNPDVDPLTHREEEIEKLIYILNKKDKPNAVILGEAGVGKTQLVLGLTHRIVNEQVPDLLKGKLVYSLDVHTVIAGASLVGQFEQRMSELIKILSKYEKKIILFIDEIHNIVGLGGNMGRGDFSNIMKPYLTSGKILVIGATTNKEYKNSFEKDKALMRRFQSLRIYEPPTEQVYDMLINSKIEYEEFHGVTINEELCWAIVKLSDRYIKYRNFPDKAFDVLDQALTKAKLDQKEEADIYDIQRVISLETKIPVENIKLDKIKALNNLESHLKTHIFGQDHIIKSVSKRVKIASLDLQIKNKPQASFLFLGPTGVGKTETARRLAEFLFGDPDNLIRIDMSEFMEQHSVSKLIGTEPGYVGYGDQNVLTDKVKERPNSVILLDEIEKAHPRILDIFLQVLDSGKLTDGQGEEISFLDTIIIMTSNIGATFSNKEIVEIGFSGGLGNSESVRKRKIKSELYKYLRPEFVNRIDEILVFNSMSEENLVKVFYKELKLINQKTEDNYKFKIELSENALDYLVSQCDKSMGARPVSRLLDKYIKDQIFEIVSNNFDTMEGKTYVINYNFKVSEFNYREKRKRKKKTTK